jgi:hypothetical protein
LYSRDDTTERTEEKALPFVAIFKYRLPVLTIKGILTGIDTPPKGPGFLYIKPHQP